MKKYQLPLLILAVAGLVSAAIYQNKASGLSALLSQAQQELAETPGGDAAQQLATATLEIEDLKSKALTRQLRITELEKELAAMETEQAAVEKSLQAEEEAQVAEKNDPKKIERNPTDWFKDRLKRMKEEDPERYAEVQKRGTEMREKATRNMSDLRLFFDGLNLEALPEELATNHVDLMSRLEGLQETINKIDSNPDQENVFNLSREMFHQVRDLRPMLDMERDALLKDMADNLGLSAEESDEVVNYIGMVNELTSTRSLMGGGGPGRGMTGGHGGGKAK